ncbi:hypothetical protein RHSIM_Rhsim07G0150600 [Rhododendron simsii]|uniref:CCHC-type domain-containing protein n=1 Tax=Rhododendron simsii TaxID=118357 RepID=A0A834LHV5_RHOSS|nr:hypothetical protein RHSIM_Rhsim07G0150600 [Rhododendron simsii]
MKPATATVQNAPPPHHVVILQGENLQANARSAEVIIDEGHVRNIQKMKPPTFEGGLNITQAEEWLTEMEKVFRVTRCTELEQTTLSTYNLKGEAQQWRNLMNLKQRRSMTVTNYDEQLTLLANYVEHHIPNEDSKARRTTNRCFRCGEMGHIKRDYPKMRLGANVVPLGNHNQGARTENQGARTERRQGKAFALVPGDPWNTEDVSVNLIPMDMRYFDVILGMDWLSHNAITIDYISKCVIFRKLDAVECCFKREGVTPPVLSFCHSCSKTYTKGWIWNFV